MINYMGEKIVVFTCGLRNRTRVWVILMIVGLAACSTTDQNAISRRDHTSELQTEVAKRVAREIELVITGHARDLQLLMQVSGFGDLPEAEQRLMLYKLLSFDNTFEELLLLDGNGQEVMRESRREIVTDSVSQDRFGEPEFTIPAEAREVYFSPITFDPVLSDPLMTISVPLTDLRTEEVTYVLVGRFRFRAIWEIIQAQELSQGQDLYLVDSDTLVVAHSSPSVVLANTQFQTRDIGTVTTGLSGDEVVIGLARFTVGEQEFTMVSELTTAVVDK